MFSCWSPKLLGMESYKILLEVQQVGIWQYEIHRMQETGPAQCCWHTSDFLKPFDELYCMFCWWNWKYMCFSDHLKLYALFWSLPYERLSVINDVSNIYFVHLQLLKLTVNTYGQTNKLCLTHSKTEFLYTRVIQ
jgi:hypothetical protein